MTRIRTLEDERFYAHALHVNWEGNNRAAGHCRPRGPGGYFRERGWPAPLPGCALLNPDHVGDVKLCRYRDRKGGRWFQNLCEAHRGQYWTPVRMGTPRYSWRLERDRLYADNKRRRQARKGA